MFNLIPCVLKDLLLLLMVQGDPYDTWYQPISMDKLYQHDQGGYDMISYTIFFGVVMQWMVLSSSQTFPRQIGPLWRFFSKVLSKTGPKGVHIWECGVRLYKLRFYFLF